jgi:hypothetical protein
VCSGVRGHLGARWGQMAQQRALSGATLGHGSRAAGRPELHRQAARSRSRGKGTSLSVTGAVAGRVRSDFPRREKVRLTGGVREAPGPTWQRPAEINGAGRLRQLDWAEAEPSWAG